MLIIESDWAVFTTQVLVPNAPAGGLALICNCALLECFAANDQSMLMSGQVEKFVLELGGDALDEEVLHAYIDILDKIYVSWLQLRTKWS